MCTPVMGRGGRYIRREKKKGGTERKIEGTKSEQRSLWEMLRSGGPRGGIDSVRGDERTYDWSSSFDERTDINFLVYLRKIIGALRGVL